ncbi:MAG: xanthine dehydrogenase small subunit [Bacteroidales bacterium]|nr:xanthine dehydrogenase small subunit [Bacteroidales bacterium]
MEAESVKNRNTYIQFLLNDELLTIDFEQDKRLSPTTTVLNYVRDRAHYKGVKEGCAEGDCGACTLVIAELGADQDLHYKTITSCIVFLPYLNGKQLFTVEYLADKQKGETQLHPVQEALVKTNGSQCGYCTPGFVMSMFNLYKNIENPEREDVEQALSGNLCRCTGYQSILDAAYLFKDLPKEDKFFRLKEKIIQDLSTITSTARSFYIERADEVYFQPQTLEEALKYKKENPQSILVGGASDLALLKTKKHQQLPHLLDLSQVLELKEIVKKEDYWEIGATVSLEQLRTSFENEFPSFRKMLDVFGSQQIRNMATLGGNLGSGSPIGDTLPVLMAHQAELLIESADEKRTEKLEDYLLGYRKTSLMPNEIITKVLLPSDDGQIMWSQKVSKRRDLDISTVSAGFSLKLTKEQKVQSIILAFGGMAAITNRAYQTEEFLLGKAWERSVIEEAMQILSDEFRPLSDARAEAEGRKLLAKNLLMKFFQETR